MAEIVPVAFFDASPVLSATSTPIPGSGNNPLEVIAKLASSVSAIAYIDTTGDQIGVFTGAVGQEKLRCVIGGGQSDGAMVAMAIGDRVSLRSLTINAITNGTISCTFLGHQPYYLVGPY